DPWEHALTMVNARQQDVTELLDTARIAGGMASRPPVLIVITARFGRLSGLPHGGAYAATLRHVGVLQQTLYLNATAMGLATCALIPRDDEDGTDRALGLDWLAESNVGEFVVGSRPTPAGPAGEGGPAASLAGAPERVPVNGADWPDRCRAVIDGHPVIQ